MTRRVESPIVVSVMMLVSLFGLMDFAAYVASMVLNHGSSTLRGPHYSFCCSCGRGVLERT
jgi:hypothetical protein